VVRLHEDGTFDAKCATSLMPTSYGGHWATARCPMLTIAE
jgi:hypothetical protein